MGTKTRLGFSAAICLAAIAVLIIAPAAEGATSGTAKVTFGGASVVKGADGSITASATFKSKQRACRNSVPFMPPENGFVSSPSVHFTYPRTFPFGLKQFALLKVGSGRWQLVMPPGTSDFLLTSATHNTPPEPVPVSTATGASMGFALAVGEGGVRSNVVSWHVKNGGSRIACKMPRDTVILPFSI
jgi:hypothetical protein